MRYALANTVAVSSAIGFIVAWVIVFLIAFPGVVAAQPFSLFALVPVALLIGHRVKRRIPELAAGTYTLVAAVKEGAGWGLLVAVAGISAVHAPYAIAAGPIGPEQFWLSALPGSAAIGAALGAGHGAIIYFLVRAVIMGKRT